MDLLKDDNAEVKLNVIGGLEQIAKIVGQEVMLKNTFTDQLSLMTKENNWRVRMAVFDLIGTLGVLFGKEIYQAKLSGIFMGYLHNTAASVRKMGIQKVEELAKTFKEDWIVQEFIPVVI